MVEICYTGKLRMQCHTNYYWHTICAFNDDFWYLCKYYIGISILKQLVLDGNFRMPNKYVTGIKTIFVVLKLWKNDAVVTISANGYTYIILLYL